MPPSPRALPAAKRIDDFTTEPVKTLLFWSLVLILACLATGRWSPHEVPDTASYLQYSFSPADAVAREVRTPGYPLVLALAQWLTSEQQMALQLVVLSQILLHALAVTCLTIEFRAWRWPGTVAIASAACVAIGCPFWDNVSTIATDCPAMSLGVITTVGLLRGLRMGFSPRLSVVIAGLVIAAISLRPAYLFLLPWAAAMTVLRCGDALPVPLGRRLRDALTIASVPLMVLTGWCAFRFHVAGDFSLLPFGHQNMAAVTTQLLDHDELIELPGQTGELAAAIAHRRVLVSRGARSVERLRQSADGLDLRLVPDPDLRADSYMTLENRWDAMTYHVVIPAAAEIAGDDIIAQHRLLAELDQQIVRTYPLRYARWWLLAIRRGIWGSTANIVMHPIFLLLILSAAAVTIGKCYFHKKLTGTLHSTSAAVPSDRPEDWSDGYRAFLLLAITYAAANLSFIALTSPAIGRFSDAGFVFIPAIAVATYFSRSPRGGSC